MLGSILLIQDTVCTLNYWLLYLNPYYVIVKLRHTYMQVGCAGGVIELGIGSFLRAKLIEVT